MADLEDFLVDGRPLSTLRVVDLKKELEKRGLLKSGAKRDLVERLRNHQREIEKLNQQSLNLSPSVEENCMYN